MPNGTFPIPPDGFDGFGAVPGIEVGSIFVNRRALSKAKVHRPLQAGICGTAKSGAESIVVSGGYEDDQDHGDFIVYTGQGGRDPNTGQQVSHQELTRGNAALVTSMTTGEPVRVIRGAAGDPQYSPTTGYRYDGLFRVEQSWHENGQAEFRIWRYRLERIDSAVGTAPKPLLVEPVGQEKPTRTEAMVQRVVRSTKVANFVKQTHDFTCQVCGIRLQTPTGAYAEAAHIRGLGQPHDGPDVTGNVLCLCPNHHALFDFGMLTIGDDLMVTDHAAGSPIGKLREAANHQIDRDHLAYHREHYSPGWKHSPDVPDDDVDAEE
ncbi:YDG/SRA domain-containing protein [Kitasatospora sp. NPDC053057]|uniref:YDG/SRA domain-containing protein n=1 Tax=Kitasatospora sp. NPDC053057 TaxID=3364062 RepID=UPI0037C69B9F